MIECLTLAQAQLGEELTSDDTGNFTIQTDGTTKYGQHYGTYDIATFGESYVLGLRHVFSGAAKDTLDTFKEILEDLDIVHRELGYTDISLRIVSKLKNTMSDRHAAEKLFNQMLSEYRADILLDVCAGWSEFGDIEKEQMIRMNNFFCGLHFLVPLADAAEATLKLWESVDLDDHKTNASSGTQRLIRTACKAFNYRGSEQARCSAYFRSYLRGNGIHKIPLAQFCGNRLNILFYDAAGVFYLKSHMENYLKFYHGPLNRLLQAVLSDLSVPKYIAGCKALGIIDKIVTGPFWRHPVHSGVTILEMSSTYSKMHALFEEWGQDAQCVIDREKGLFDDHECKNDIVADKLFQPTSDDLMVQELLQLLFKLFALTAERLLSDHLQGGDYECVTDTVLIKETKSVPLTNVAPERDFAVLDRLISHKPNATTIALESIILYSHNKTSNWLKNKPQSEQNKLIEAARTLTKVHKANFCKRRKEIEALRLKMVQKRQEEITRKSEKELKVKEGLTKKLQKLGGLWTTEEEIEDGLRKMKTTKAKQNALKIQISFRKKVLGQLYSDKVVFQFSHNKQPFSDTRLKQNLLKLLSSHAEVQDTLTNEDIFDDLEVLIYRRIEHLFSCNGEMIWFTGTILGYNKDTEEFSVAYDNEDCVYCFPLLEDLAKGEFE